MALALVLASLAPATASAAYVFPEVPRDSWDTNGKVFAVEIIGETVYVGGSFSQVRNPGSTSTLSRENFAAFNLTTGDVLPLRADTDGPVRSIETSGNRVWIGGTFSEVGGEERKNIAALDGSVGSLDPDFDIDVDGPVLDMAFGNGSLYVAGLFTEVGDVDRYSIAALDPVTGAARSAFDAKANASVRTVVVSRAAGRVFIGGSFTYLDGAPRAHVSEVDPTTGAAVGLGYELAEAPLIELDVTGDGSIVFGAVAGLENRAQAWSTFSGKRLWYQRAMGDVQAIAFHDRVVYFGFHEGFEDDLTVRLLAIDVWTGELVDFSPPINSFYGVWAIAASPAGLAIGGEFSEVAGVRAKGFAVFPGAGGPPDTSPPEAPGGVRVGAPGEDGIALEWDPASDDHGVSYYRIFRDGQRLATTFETRYVDSDVVPSEVYSYQIQASDFAGNVSSLSPTLEVAATTRLIAPGSEWYFDDTERSANGWTQSGFDHGSWSHGSAQLGFGEGDEATVLEPGEMTYYFRRWIDVPAGWEVLSAELGIVRDDGAIVYVNGTEVFRTNMPSGSVTGSTPAAGTTSGSDENRWYTTSIDAGLWEEGANLVAVEVHQRSRSSSDVSFDLRLDAQLGRLIVDEEAPTRPGLLTAKARDERSTIVRWQPSDDNVAVAGYQVFRNGEPIAITTKTRFVDRNLWPDTTYRYKVKAVDAAGNESFRSRVRSATTPSDETPPSRPQQVEVTAGTKSIALSWSPATDNVGVARYIIKSSGKRIGRTTGTSFVYAGLKPDTEYHVAVFAVDVFGNRGPKIHRRVVTSPRRVTYEAIGPDHVWRYLAQRGAPDSDWRERQFDDAGWSSGVGEFGYGDGDEATVVGYGSSTRDKYVTTYFRGGFTVDDAGAVQALELRLVRDDGVVIYINGIEVFRDNMPTGPVDGHTLAVEGISGHDESDWLVVLLPVDALVDGENLLAVEVHQSDPSSSDMSFDARLTVNP